MLGSPFPIRSTGLLSLVGINERVDASEYGASVAHTLASTDDPVPMALHSGEILGLVVISTKSGSGIVQLPAGTLLVLTANPATGAGDAALTAAEHRTVLAAIPIAATDWHGDSAGAVVTKSVAIAFESLASLSFVLKLDAGAASINDAGPDNELLQLVARYRLDT